MRKLLPLVAVALLGSFGCSTSTPAPAVSPQPTPTASSQSNSPALTQAKNAMARALIGDHGFDMTGIDRSVAPCDDFYRFSVGKWRDTHPLPAQYPRYGRFEELAERNRETLRAILEESARDTTAPAGSTTRKIGDYYAACMNEAAIETAGVTPIRPELDRIDAVHDTASLQDELFRLQQGGFSPLFRFSAQQDYKNSTMTIANLSQGGLGLPDRDYYLRDDDRFTKTRAAYVEHVAKMFVLAGESPEQAAADAKRVMMLESRLAKASMTRVEQRVPEKTYHITTVTDLSTTDPNLGFPRFFNSLGIGDLQSLNVEQPEFISETNRMIAEVPVDDWKAYMRWRVIDAAAPTLSSAFVNEDFAFSGRTLSGQKEQQERWKRCVRSADAAIGQLIGQEYVRRNFTPEAKAKADHLIDNLIGALRADIPTLSWMGPETKKAALEKLAAFQRRIGYPDKWRDYSTLTLTPDSYARNGMASRAFAFQRAVSRIGKPDDPNEWGFFTPSTVNASYAPSRNDITFPAGILQPPFYDPNADDAYNYGGIGTVIGHEMTHGFDDEGAKFDAKGNLRDWWTPEDKKNFEARAECIATEYSEFNVETGLNINGHLVTGESIADLGGATIALAAYEKSLQGKPRETIDGFSPEQRFFLGFAQVWGENMAPEEARRRALTDPHAQGPFRVNGTVQNMPAFHKAFDCHDDAKMVRLLSKRCSIW